MSLWWSFMLTALGVAGLFLTMRRNRFGPWMGVLVQVPWAVYAVVSTQWWFLVSAFAFGAVNVYGIVLMQREKGI